MLGPSFLAFIVFNFSRFTHLFQETIKLIKYLFPKKYRYIYLISMIFFILLYLNLNILNVSEITTFYTHYSTSRLTYFMPELSDVSCGLGATFE